MDDFSKLNFYSYENTLNHTNIKGSQFGFTGDNFNLKPKGVLLIENWVEQIFKNYQGLYLPTDCNFIS